MSVDLEEDGPLLCAAVFFAGFIVFALCETYWPRVRLVASLGQRWIANIGLYVLYFVLIAAIGQAIGSLSLFDPGTGFGIGAVMGWSLPLGLALGFVVADAVRYASHRLHHVVPFLWRLHAIHHSDRDLDVTTTLRHHPLEGVSMWIVTGVAYALLGVPLLAIVVYEVAATALSTIQHANLRLPLALERHLVTGVVTPDMHRIHHSVRAHEGNANFGIVLSLWDRLFRTYVTLNHSEHERLVVGVAESRADSERLHLILLSPFLRSRQRSNVAT
jgi:sterol desaturase/sphingolipid hydroxylase (fatty acid hydroxylase superfamily)